MYKEHVQKIKILLLAVFSIAALSGCNKIAEVAAPEVQAVSSQMLMAVETDRIYDHISINGVSVGGLTKDEAVKKVTEELLSPLKNQKIIVKREEQTWPLELVSLNYKYDIEKGVEEAYEVARTGTTEERYDKITSLKSSPYEITLEANYEKNVMTQFLMDLAQEVNEPAVEPTMKRENGKVVTVPGSDGVAVDISETRAKMIELADNLTGGEVSLVIIAVPPKFSEDELLKSHVLIGSYSTPITGSPSRDINLTIASGYINGVTVYPGQVFSTNETIGPTTYDRGYRNAPVIVNGKLEDGIGGGVCQVSSTLYNAVLFSELEIVERRNHGLMVGYCPPGRDATLAEGWIDFRFKNDTEFPIYVESYLEGKRLVVNIYGVETRPANRTVDFESAYVAERTYDVYKKVMVDGAVVERIWINRSGYKAPVTDTPEETPEETPPEETPVVPETPEELIDNSTPPEWLAPLLEPEPSSQPVYVPEPVLDFGVIEQE